jgi:benzylsuccinate CoA-transferase BbsF subunit
VAKSTAPLEGIKIADFSWSVVGPAITTFLSYYGAEVVKIESIYTPEVTRRSAPYKDGIAGIDRSLMFARLNTNKFSLSLNLKHPKSREIVQRLIAWADIVVQSATNNTLDRLGLNYTDLKEVKKDIIVLNTTSQGQTGPYCNHPGWGDATVALAGFPELTGWPDRDPCIPAAAYTDVIAPWFGVLSILAALEYREHKGLGQHIDFSQLEAGIHMLEPAISAYSANNVICKRAGNRSLTDAPHGVYQCRGDDRWCAIAVTSEEEWQAFCQALGNPNWARDDRFTTMLQRKENEAELDKLIEEWTVTNTAEEVMMRLQKAGVAAAVVENIKDYAADPQLKHRGHFQTLKHREIGDYTVELPSARFSGISADLRRPAPCLGEHTYSVCCELLGMSAEEFVQLYSEGVFAISNGPPATNGE